MTYSRFLFLIAAVSMAGGLASCADTKDGATDGGIGGTGIKEASESGSGEVLSSAAAVTSATEGLRLFSELTHPPAAGTIGQTGIRGGTGGTLRLAPASLSALRRSHFQFDTTPITTAKGYWKCDHNADGSWTFTAHDAQSNPAETTDFTDTYAQQGKGGDCELNSDYLGTDYITKASCKLNFAELMALAQNKPTSSCIPLGQTAAGVSCQLGPAGCDAMEDLSNNEYDDLLGVTGATFKSTKSGGASEEGKVAINRSAKTWTMEKTVKGSVPGITSVVEKIEYTYSGRGEPDAEISLFQDWLKTPEKAKLVDYATQTCGALTPAALCTHLKDLITFVKSESFELNPSTKEDLVTKYTKITTQADGTVITEIGVPDQPFFCQYNKETNTCAKEPTKGTSSKTTQYPAGSTVAKLEEKASVLTDAVTNKSAISLEKTTTRSDGTVAAESINLTKDESTGAITGTGKTKDGPSESCIRFDGNEAKETGKLDKVETHADGSLVEEHVDAPTKGKFAYGKSIYASGQADCAAYTVTGGKLLESTEATVQENADGTGSLSITNPDGSSIHLASTKACTGSVCTVTATGEGKDKRGSFTIAKTDLPSGSSTLQIDWTSADGKEKAKLDLTLAVDGTSTGTLQHNDAVYDATIQPDGSARICLKSGSAPGVTAGQCLTLSAADLAG
ncbi:MAG: hypothetical protein HYT87_08165 [Nitrospirae bacterium]|nr:hypothetical protein [Nitrospirota bacterium]